MLDRVARTGLDAAAPLLGAAGNRPAGGAALGQVIGASVAAAVLTAVLLVLGWGHRSGRITLLGRLAALSERGLGRGLPGWSSLPIIVALGSLLTALLGMYWDISLHITRGRDSGPLANIAHYPILIGLFGIFTAGVLAVVLPAKGVRPGRAAVRITRDWYAPAGGVLLAGTGFYALLGFPLDDVWHRIFGQDVTLWGPTHLMLIGGAGLSLVAMMILEREGRAAHDDSTGDLPAWGRYVRRGMHAGGLLIGLSVYQAEFDFGVEQFRQVHQPLLIALAAGVALVAARLWVGRGGAVFAVVFYMLVRGGVSLLVGGAIGQLWASVPLYFGEALCVELAALPLARRPLALGAVSGVLIGTAGFATEYAWTHVAFVLPWTGDIVVEGVLMAVVGGVAGGVCGAMLAEGLQGRLPRPAIARGLFTAAIIAFSAAALNCQLFQTPKNQTATIDLTDARSGDHRTVNAVVTFNPRTIADHPAWVQITAWQGGGLHVERLTEQSPGVYRTTRPVPVHGDWKTLVRVHDGRDLAAVPIYLPDDEAIGAKELPAPAHFTRPVQKERSILQRELKSDVPGWLWAACAAIVLLCTLAMVIALGWGVARIARALPEPARAPTGTEPQGPREPVTT
ncbi:hypothetical protein [Actinomadura parmotrematis]|uniref:Uncharacterized protein n=1 Tax=Actinomadura parmotrematis TaxID=2864039 RepID=A0ABS7FQC4_9ACTN|nr:hypothetical protein [Actinomadura parmotrematis]MBW8482566.1 hypothetical protein [Actinomadura parmotrematis]